MAVLDHVGIFVVSLNGVTFSGDTAARVTEFEFDQKENHTDECTVVFTGSAAERSVFRDLLETKKGDPFEVRWGYPNQLSPLFRMRVESVCPMYGATVTVKIVARDHGDVLHHHERTEVYANATYRQVIETVARRNGFTLDLPQNASFYLTKSGAQVFSRLAGASRSEQLDAATARRGGVPSAPAAASVLDQRAPLAQVRETDLAFLRRLGAMTNNVVRFDGKKLVFRPLPVDSPPSHAYVWRDGGGSLVSFDPEEGQHHKGHRGARGVRAHGVNRDSKQIFDVLVNDRSTAGRPVIGAELPFGVSSSSSSSASPGPRDRDTATLRAGGALIVDRNQGGRVVGVHSPSSASVPPQGAVLPSPSGRRDDALRDAAAVHGRGEQGGVKAKATVLGDPTLAVSSLIHVNGVDGRHAGTWMVRGAKHKVGSGYTVLLELQRHGQEKPAPGAQTSGRPNTAAPQSRRAPAVTALRVDRNQGGRVIGVGQ